MTRLVNFDEGVKITTRRGEITTGSPVLGLRPGRADFNRVTNFPNPGNFTMPSEIKLSSIFSKTESTSFEDSDCESPISR